MSKRVTKTAIWVIVAIVVNISFSRIALYRFKGKWTDLRYESQGVAVYFSQV